MGCPPLCLVRDREGRTPPHMAAANGQTDVLRILLLPEREVDSNLHLVLDKDGRTPPHLAAANGHIDALRVLLRQREVADVVTEGGETMLHESVKHGQLEAVKFIIETYGELLVNTKDGRGNTALHLATIRRHTQIIKLLLQDTTIDVNSTNEHECTALDVLLQFRSNNIEDMELCEILLHYGGRNGHRTSFPAQRESPQKRLIPNDWDEWYRKDSAWKKNMQNTLMIVSTVIASATFQTGLNPPGGTRFNKDDDNSFVNFVSFDMVALAASLAIILLLVSGIPLNRPTTWVLVITLWLAIFSMGIAFVMGIFLLTHDDAILKPTHIIVKFWLSAVAFIVLYHAVVMLGKILQLIAKLCPKFWDECRKRCRLLCKRNATTEVGSEMTNI